MITIEYSSMCFNLNNYKEKIEKAQKLINNTDFQLGIQIHNSIEKDLFDKLIQYKDEIPFTIHSPLFSKYFINLASHDFHLMQKILHDNRYYLDLVHTNLLFFHGFFMTRELIAHDMKNYRKTMRSNISEKYSLNKSFIMNPAFFSTEEFNEYKRLFIINYSKIKTLFSDYILCIENDFVGIGSGLQRPEEILEIIDNLWFDLGHFWCSSLLHKFDYYEKCEEIIQKKKIFGVHVNHNLMTHTHRHEDLADSHTHLYVKNEQNLKPVIHALREKGVNLFTLEIIDGDIEDVRILLDWLG